MDVQGANQLCNSSLTSPATGLIQIERIRIEDWTHESNKKICKGFTERNKDHI